MKHLIFYPTILPLLHTLQAQGFVQAQKPVVVQTDNLVLNKAWWVDGLAFFFIIILFYFCLFLMTSEK